jgi:hypothetical protein
MSSLLTFATELLSESEEDQMSSNTNSYDYGEAGHKDTRGQPSLG